MVIVIKNKPLHKRIMKAIKVKEDMALKMYKNGNIKRGRHYEKISDNIYSKNYNLMFEVKK